jgi:hypothetical protein
MLCEHKFQKVTVNKSIISFLPLLFSFIISLFIKKYNNYTLTIYFYVILYLQQLNLSNTLILF